MIVQLYKGVTIDRITYYSERTDISIWFEFQLSVLSKLLTIQNQEYDRLDMAVGKRTVRVTAHKMQIYFNDMVTYQGVII